MLACSSELLFLQTVEKKFMLVVFDGRVFDVLDFCFN